MKLQESGENYLETILLLEEQYGTVRSIDVAEYLGFSRASICRAIGILRDAGYVDIGAGGNLQLTPSGRAAALAVYERHRLISEFLQKTLGVCAKTASQDACRIEHIISEECFERIKALAETGYKTQHGFALGKLE